MDALLSLVEEPRASILRHINEAGHATVEELVDQQGLSATTIRHHLDKLIGEQLIIRRRRRTGPGRPTHTYHLSERARHLFPNQEKQLFPMLLKFLITEGHGELIDAFFEQIWHRHLQRLQRRLRDSDASSLEDRLELLLGFFDEQGFMPQLKKSEDGHELSISLCHCPFESTIEHTNLPCRLEKQTVVKFLGSTPSRTCHIASGDTTCTYTFTIPT